MTGTRTSTALGLCVALAPGFAAAQQALPTIEVGAAPLRAPVARRQAPPPSAPVAAPARSVARAPVSPVVQYVAPVVQYPVVTYTVPSAAHVVTSHEIANTRQFDLSTALERSAPGVSINDVRGNPFSPEIDYRGFVASPVKGTPQGLAVYQNGVRINEAWGDTVNWDLIPSVAIDRVAIVTGNPLFGLNAIGGAVVLDMKTGFTWQGFELDGRGGSRSAAARSRCNMAWRRRISPAISRWRRSATMATENSPARI